VKQEIRSESRGSHKFASIAYEAAVYDVLESVFGDRPVSASFPKSYGFDRDAQFLILEGLAGWVSLAEHYARLGRFSASLAGELGATLAEFHSVSPRERTLIEQRIGVPAAPPWIFSLSEPDQWIYENSSLATIELLQIIQQSDDLCGSIEDLRHRWQDGGFIHGDLKWDNCLVHSDQRHERVRTLKIVDWEVARIGDPDWDVGTVLGCYLDAWLSSIPISSRDEPDQFMELARLPLHVMQPGIGAFWTAYLQSLDVGNAEAAERLERVTSFAGVRLLQTAFEQSQADDRLSGRAVLLVQLCANILARPLEAAIQLLGLPLPERLAWSSPTTLIR
jgi:hypothetical protein